MVLPRAARVKITISGVTFETTLPVIKRSIIESLGGVEVSDDQWTWLARLHSQEEIEVCASDLATLRPLRNAGLIRARPKGYLQNAKAVKISTLGKLLVEASGRG